MHAEFAEACETLEPLGQKLMQQFEIHGYRRRIDLNRIAIQKRWAAPPFAHGLDSLA